MGKRVNDILLSVGLSVTSLCHKIDSLLRSLVKPLIRLSVVSLMVLAVLAVAACTYSRSVTAGMESSIDVSMYTNHTPRMINMFLPNTTWLHVKPCALFFDEEELMEEALSCANEKVWPDEQVTIRQIGIPACHVISRDSPDTMRFGLANLAIYKVGPFVISAVLGFYNPQNHETFIVENLDMKMIYRHEIQHHLLNTHPTHSEEGDHQHEIFEKCEPARYEKSAALKLLEEFLGIKE